MGKHKMGPMRAGPPAGRENVAGKVWLQRFGLTEHPSTT